jgi:hypothetical protein
MRQLLLMIALAFAPTLAMAQQAAPPANIYNAAPFTAGSLFASVPCGQPFACSPSALDRDYLAAANACANSRFGFPAEMMTVFEIDGAYENCALPESYQPKGGRFMAAAQWPVCCIEDKGDNVCEFTCHFYRSNGG